jgi:tetratricopeptide (TPR) repeat protein
MMRTKSIYFTAILFSLTMSSSLLAKTNIDAFKIAVVEDSFSSKNIINGLYHSSINKLTRYNRNANTYKSNMNLCVAYLKVGNIKKSTKACRAAVVSAESAASKDNNANYLKALSYSNRAIARFKNSDISGAIADLDKAVSIDANDITDSNLRVMKQKLQLNTEATLKKL